MWCLSTRRSTGCISTSTCRPCKRWAACWDTCGHRGQRFASTTAVVPMTEAFVHNIEQFVAGQGVDLITFEKGQRKDDVTQRYLQKFKKSEGVLLSARRRKRPASCGPSVVAQRAPERPIRGSCNRRPWSTITTSIASTKTSGRSF